MRFNVVGADRDTGENIEMTVDAADEVAAQGLANRKGILVSHVTRVLAVRSPVAQTVPMRQPLEQGQYAGAPVVNIGIPRRGNSLGVASVILGILAFLICWIPFVNLLGVPLSALGFLLGLLGLVVALTRKGASIGYPIAGLALCGLALLVAVTMTGAFVTGLKKAGDELARERARANATNQTARAPTVRDMASPGSPKPDSTPAAEMAPPVPTPVVLPEKKPEAEWASAETPIRQGDVQVQVKSARVGKVPLKERIGDGTGQSKDVLLMVELEVTNLSDTKKLDYRTWGGRAISFGNRTALTDNFDNRYKVVNFGFGDAVVGSVESESVYPGKSVGDVLVFEEPIGKVQYLNLELSATQFGGEGMLRIRIPASMVQK